MRHSYLFPILIITLALFSFSCDEVEEQMNKMTAKIDGEKWTSRFRATVMKDSAIVITATNKLSKDEGQQIAITIFGTNEGRYLLSADSVSAQCGAVYKPDASVEDESQYFLSKSGEVRVKSLDTENNKISGTFEFSMIKDVSGKTIEITEGEFNELRYTNVSGN